MSATALNIFHNFLLRSETKDQTLSIAINNHPITLNAAEQVIKHKNQWYEYYYSFNYC